MSIFENLSKKFKCHKNLGTIMGTFREGQYTFSIKFCSILLRMRKCQVVDKSKTQAILCSITFFSENRVFHEIMRKVKVERDRKQMEVKRGSNALRAG